MHLIDWLIVLIPTALVIYIGWKTHLYSSGVAGFLAGGRVAGREPDFFELLQASLPVGSLGKSLGKTHAYVTAPGDDVARDIFSKYQILQIGANIIDQWDADSYPTAIRLQDANDFTFSGIENLPYLTRIFENTFKDTAPHPANPNGPPVEFMHYFIHPEVWNPHQAADSPPAAPEKLRFVMEGSYTLTVEGSFAPGGTLEADGSRGILFDNDSQFREPKLLDFIGSAIDPRDTKSPTNAPPFVGMLMGSFTPPRGTWQNNLITPAPTISYHLQYNRDGRWITYSSMREHMLRFLMSNPNWSSTGTYPSIIRYWVGRSDPRVERFGFILSYDYGGIGSGTKPNETQRPSFSNPGAQVWEKDPPTRYYGWHPTTPSLSGWTWGYYLGMLTGNKQGSQTWYADADGVNRLGDAAFSNNTLSGEPMQTGNLPSRPVILNRPFRSVAEMGYAGRDMPWKTLDFFTADSADGALLDAFSLAESAAGGMVAGKLYLSSVRAEVVESLLVGAEILAGDEITAAQAENLGAQIQTAVEANPLASLADLPASINSQQTVAAELGPSANAAIKARREVLSRALAPHAQVRAWNLFADIVAQSGRFQSDGSTAASDFIVDAEVRTWSHLAIDRPTATILATQNETITE